MSFQKCISSKTRGFSCLNTLPYCDGTCLGLSWCYFLVCCTIFSYPDRKSCCIVFVCSSPGILFLVPSWFLSSLVLPPFVELLSYSINVIKCMVLVLLIIFELVTLEISPMNSNLRISLKLYYLRLLSVGSIIFLTNYDVMYSFFKLIVV